MAQCFVSAAGHDGSHHDSKHGKKPSTSWTTHGVKSMRTRKAIATTAMIAHAAVDLVLILALGSAAVLLDKWDAIRKVIR